MEDEILVADVIEYYRPNGWVIFNNNFDEIVWTDAEPITREEFDAGFELVKQKRAKEKLEKTEKRQALLKKLGISEDEAKLLLS